MSDRHGDVEQIRRLCADYCWYVDTAEIEPLVALFTEDAVFDAEAMGVGRMEGATGLRTFFSAVARTMSSSQHLNTNFRIDVDGDRATCVSYFHADGATVDGGSIAAAGYYSDEWVRTPMGWRIRRREGHPLLTPNVRDMTSMIEDEHPVDAR